MSHTNVASQYSRLALACYAVLIVVVLTIVYTVIRVAETGANNTRIVMSNAAVSSVQQCLSLYLDSNGQTLPSAINRQGGTEHSWRATLNMQVLPDRLLNFSEPWDSPGNLEWAWFNCAGKFTIITDFSGKLPWTCFFVVIGESTAFPPEGPLALADISDGLENTVLVVEAKQSDVAWTEPRDIDIDFLEEFYAGKGSVQYGAIHTAGPSMIFADLQVYRMKKQIPYTVFLSLFTVDGQEPWTRSWLVDNGYLVHQPTRWVY